jgi:hypothetical protein
MRHAIEQVALDLVHALGDNRLDRLPRLRDGSAGQLADGLRIPRGVGVTGEKD